MNAKCQKIIDNLCQIFAQIILKFKRNRNTSLNSIVLVVFQLFFLFRSLDSHPDTHVPNNLIVYLIVLYQIHE